MRGTFTKVRVRCHHRITVISVPVGTRRNSFKISRNSALSRRPSSHSARADPRDARVQRVSGRARASEFTPSESGDRSAGAARSASDVQCGPAASIRNARARCATVPKAPERADRMSCRLSRNGPPACFSCLVTIAISSVLEMPGVRRNGVKAQVGGASAKTCRPPGPADRAGASESGTSPATGGRSVHLIQAMAGHLGMVHDEPMQTSRDQPNWAGADPSWWRESMLLDQLDGTSAPGARPPSRAGSSLVIRRPSRLCPSLS
jgi:hypothetical protein